ncbi:13810_t:CDS:2, partial [Gigaspora rosea]
QAKLDVELVAGVLNRETGKLENIVINGKTGEFDKHILSVYTPFRCDMCVEKRQANNHSSS